LIYKIKKADRENNFSIGFFFKGRNATAKERVKIDYSARSFALAFPP